MKARAAAFAASLFWKKKPIEPKIIEWITKDKPDPKDIALCKEIAFGTIKRWLSLEYICSDLISKKMPFQEKLLLYQAAYQLQMMSQIPPYAVLFETVEIAKKKWDKKKAGFFNALLRRFEEKKKSLEEVKDDFSLYFGYPNYFIDQLGTFLDRQQVEDVLIALNQFPKPCVRLRDKVPYDVTILYEGKLISGHVEDRQKWAEVIQDSRLHIQNVTNTYLIDKLASSLTKKPQKILDICASPGGKLIALHDLFSHAEFVANDLSEAKLALLQDNIRAFQINARITKHPAEKYPLKETFDLIICDLPCSASGVLGKCPEARHRLSKKEIDALVILQTKILRRAIKLLEKGGVLWVITCSILPNENEALIKTATKEGLRLKTKHQILPNTQGWEGGFGAFFEK
jgi:16S rRNA (cytosine967-C5)-methyltransferase